MSQAIIFQPCRDIFLGWTSSKKMKTRIISISCSRTQCCDNTVAGGMWTDLIRESGTLGTPIVLLCSPYLKKYIMNWDFECDLHVPLKCRFSRSKMHCKNGPYSTTFYHYEPWAVCSLQWQQSDLGHIVWNMDYRSFDTGKIGLWIRTLPWASRQQKAWLVPKGLTSHKNTQSTPRAYHIHIIQVERIFVVVTFVICW